MKHIQLFVLLILGFHQVNAQAISQPTGTAAERNLEDLGSRNFGGMVWTYDNRYEGVKGTPYFNDDWNNANIYIQNSVFEKVPVKYNVLENKLLFKNKSGTELVLDVSKINQFVLTNENSNNIVFKKLGDLATVDQSLSQQFVLVLHEGKHNKFVKANSKKILKTNYKEGYSSGNKYDEIIENNTYYLVDGNKALDKVKLNKKSLLSALADKEDAVKSYLNKESIDVSTEEGWIKALAYYETL